MYINNHLTQISNVLVIGCGGAGLRAAIEVKLAGLEVLVLGKRVKTDSHTVLAAGGINAAFGNIDPEDSWEHHFADTYLEGYGIGDPLQIELMAKESPTLVKEIDRWGANFAKLENGSLDQRYFGAHTYRRTCYSGDYTGLSILKALLKKADALNIPIDDNQYVTDLLIRDKVCFGAMSFNTRTNERTVHIANAVILCTGGHTKIWKRSSSRKNENTGDGYYLSLKAGCELTDMEMVQFHPSGILLPEEIAGTLVTEAVRGEGGKLINSKGERFMANYDKKRMELSTRDRVAIANYTEIVEGRGTPNGGVYLDISHKSKEFIMKKLPSIYKQFLDTQMLDISKHPMEVAPTAHYSMGGVFISPEDHCTSIRGLYAAGEVAGGLHGANRLGGNSLAEILIFGKRAGLASISYSKQINSHIKSDKSIKKAHENINRFLRKGTEAVTPLQLHLSNTMWKYCGVIKDKELLETGLKKVLEIKDMIESVNIRSSDSSYKDLIQIFNLEASVTSAQATILSALQRKESRGAHQRSDYPKLNPSERCNYHIKLNKRTLDLDICVNHIAPLQKNHQDIISSSDQIVNFEGKLIE
ncbi:FAD-dependent oxidoreductase [Prochlorococcus sp. MIT 1307]|uniref:FAD-dependent oxidoreductase n=1 Tax=Prochlorococcus sp. MIT 1307 TaxID=3096219 RepID=UPI002A75C498|nr:FAD-dependent oxidoreductase [Prochlorococcus sp. MIT 1307]